MDIKGCELLKQEQSSLVQLLPGNQGVCEEPEIAADVFCDMTRSPFLPLSSVTQHIKCLEVLLFIS